MELEALKEKLGDEMFTQLQTYVTELTSQRDQARTESISGRKGLKAENEQLKAAQTTLLEKLGVESLDDLENLPDAKGLAEAGKQFETQIKRLTRERDAAVAAQTEINTKYLDSKKAAVLADALGAHEFLAKDVVTSFISNQLVWEGDELLFKTDEGQMVTVKDGVSGVAKARPELLKPAGTGGAGVRSSNARGDGQQKTMTRADFDAADPAARMKFVKEGGKVAA